MTHHECEPQLCKPHSRAPNPSPAPLTQETYPGAHPKGGSRPLVVRVRKEPATSWDPDGSRLPSTAGCEDADASPPRDAVPRSGGGRCCRQELPGTRRIPTDVITSPRCHLHLFTCHLRQSQIFTSLTSNIHIQTPPPAGCFPTGHPAMVPPSTGLGLHP